MGTISHRGVVSGLARAIPICAIALFQTGCLDEIPTGDGPRDEQATAQADSKAGAANAVGDFWIADYISVDHPSGTIGPKVLDIQGVSKQDGARAQLWDTTGGNNQKWEVIKAGTFQGYATYWLVALHSDKCLDMAIDGAVGNGTRVQQWSCNTTANQEWIAIAGSGWGELRNRFRPDLCLDVTGVRYANGSLLQVWQCSGNWNQRWNIYP